MIKVYCSNTKKSFHVEPGTTLAQFAVQSGVDTKWPVLAAIVDNQLKELAFPIYMTHNVEFIDYSHSDGARTYIRSLIL